MLGKLYLVATPIGNLADISFRAIETLKAADLIACEDTRHSRKLLAHYGISKKLISYHEHNEKERAEELGGLLMNGKSIAVISDAGTPAICDPAFRIVNKAIEIGAEVVSIPGAAAFLSALSASGLPSDSFFFGGFLPPKSGERQKRLKEAASYPATLIFYEAPHRLGKSLADCLKVLGNRKTAIARELTKLHEEIIRGDLESLSARFEKEEVKGEVVLLFGREEGPRKLAGREKELPKMIGILEEKGMARKAALRQAARELGIKRDEAYRIMMNEDNI